MGYRYFEKFCATMTGATESIKSIDIQGKEVDDEYYCSVKETWYSYIDQKLDSTEFDFQSFETMFGYLEASRNLFASVAKKAPNPFHLEIKGLDAHGDIDPDVTYVITKDEGKTLPYRLQQYNGGKPTDTYTNFRSLVEAVYEVQEMNAMRVSPIYKIEDVAEHGYRVVFIENMDEDDYQPMYKSYVQRKTEDGYENIPLVKGEYYLAEAVERAIRQIHECADRMCEIENADIELLDDTQSMLLLVNVVYPDGAAATISENLRFEDVADDYFNNTGDVLSKNDIAQMFEEHKADFFHSHKFFIRLVNKVEDTLLHSKDNTTAYLFSPRATYKLLDLDPSKMTYTVDKDVQQKIIEEATILISKENADFIKNTSEMTGDEIYNKYGVHRYEDMVISAMFSNGYEVEIRHCIGDGDDTPFVTSTLYDEKGEPISSDDGYNGSDIIGKWEFEDIDERGNESVYKASVVDASTLTREQKEDIIQQGSPNNLLILAKDDDPQIRAMVATKKDPDSLELLSQDPNPEVRMEVAYQGYNPSIMMYDRNRDVRKAVAEVAKIQKDYETLNKIATREMDMLIREDVERFLCENPEPTMLTPNYTLVSQGIAIYSTNDFTEAYIMWEQSNKEYSDYVQKSIDENEPYADNEVFIYENSANGVSKLLSDDEIEEKWNSCKSNKNFAPTLVICKPDGEISEASKDHLIYARVVSVDRKADIVVLDKYLKEGRLHSKSPSKLPLTRLEDEGYYQPMNDEEILKFRDGLAELVTSPHQVNRLDNIDVRATFEVVNEIAEKIVQKNEKEIKKSSTKSASYPDR